MDVHGTRLVRTLFFITIIGEGLILLNYHFDTSRDRNIGMMFLTSLLNGLASLSTLMILLFYAHRQEVRQLTTHCTGMLAA